MPLVEITLWAGRSQDVKEQMISEVTEAVSRTSGAPPDAVEVLIREVPKSDWGIGGETCSKKFPDR